MAPLDDGGIETSGIIYYMLEGESQQIRHIRLEPGQAIVVSVVKPDLGTFHPDLRQRLDSLIRRSANNARFALGGDTNDQDAFDGNFGKEIEDIGKNLHKAGIPLEEVETEITQILLHEPHGNIDGRTAHALTGFYVPRLSYSPKEAA
ncbi:MAG: hypothetical protein AAB414_01900 [Patescibacteria group bacterium]